MISPPKIEGDQAIGNPNGNNPSKPTPENSIEVIVITEKDPHILRGFLKLLLSKCSSKVTSYYPDEEMKNYLATLQRGLLNILAEARYSLRKRKEDKQFIAIKDEYLNRVINFYTSEIFLSDETISLDELDPKLLKLVERRLEKMINSKTWDELKFDYTNRRRMPNFIRHVFSNKVDSTLSIIANHILTIVNQNAWRTNTRTEFIDELQFGVSQLGDHIYRIRLEAWKRNSPRLE